MFKGILNLLVFGLSFLGIAQNEALFNQATTAYNEGEFENAVSSYEQIIENGQHSAELYYNLGNAYYKLNKIAPSIYYYEKALLLKPNDSEILNNLSYAQNMTLDAIEALPETGLSKIYDNVVNFLSFDQWAYTAITGMLLFVFCYIAFYYFDYSSSKRIAFITSLVCISFTIIALLFAFMQYNDFNKNQPAIVFVDEVNIKSDPNSSGQEVFKLHSGAKIFVLDQLNDWKKIKIANGKTGWIQAEDIKLLKDF